MIHVLQVVPSLELGGAERMVVDLTLRLHSDGWEVSVVSLWSRAAQTLDQRLKNKQIPVFYLGKTLGFDTRMLQHIDSVVRKVRPDIVHTHLGAIRYAMPSALIRRLPVLHTVHSLAEHETNLVGRFINRFAMAHGVVPVAVANEVARSIERAYGITKVPVIPNGVDLHEFGAEPDTARSQWRLDEGFGQSDFIFVSVAGLKKPKNHLLLLHAFSLVAMRSTAAQPHLVLVGDGELRAEIEAQVRCLGVQAMVHILGWRTDIPRILASADAFVLASDYEGNPLSVMEAMAAGKPVICTAVGGIPELVSHGVTGLLVPPGDVETLAGAMMRVLEDRDMRIAMSSVAMECASMHFGVDKMVKRYENAYHSAMTGRFGNTRGEAGPNDQLSSHVRQ